MSEARDAALDAFVRLATEKGYTAISLRDVAHAAGLGFAEFHSLFPDKGALLAAFAARIDGEVLKGVPSSRDPEETARDRLFDTMMRRYDALKPYRAFLRRLRQGTLRDPLLAFSLAPAMGRSMACMLEAAAIPAGGLSGALRQTGLLTIHHAVLSVFESDESLDLSKTMAALDRRLKTAESWSQAIDKYGEMLPSRSRPPAPDSRAP